MLTKFIVGKILHIIFSLVLEDSTSSKEKFVSLCDEWLDSTQSEELYVFLRSWFYEDIVFPMIEDKTAESILPLQQNSLEEGVKYAD